MTNDEAVEWLLNLKDLDICGENRKTAIDKAVTALRRTPLETAEWLEDNLTKFRVVCSKCGCRHFGADRIYCPRCGRKMETGRGEKNEDHN